MSLLKSYVNSNEAGVALHRSEKDGDHLVAYVPFKSFQGGLFLEETPDVALAVPRQLQRIGLFLGSTTILLVSLGAWWYARRITTPLEQLASAAQVIADGSFEQKIDVELEGE